MEPEEQGVYSVFISQEGVGEEPGVFLKGSEAADL